MSVRCLPPEEVVEAVELEEAMGVAVAVMEQGYWSKGVALPAALAGVVTLTLAAAARPAVVALAAVSAVEGGHC